VNYKKIKYCLRFQHNCTIRAKGVDRVQDKKWLSAVILLFGVFFYLFICFAVDAQKILDVATELRGRAPSSNQPYHLVLIEQEQSHPYWQMVEKGALESAQQYGMEIEFNGPVRFSMEEQIKLLEKAIAAKVDGIIVQGLNDSKFSPVINRAIEKGIPVLTIDTDAPNSKRLAYVGTDNFEAGKQLGYTVVKATGGKGKIGVIIGSDTAENQILRLKGFQSIVEQYPDMVILSVRSSNISRIEAIQQAVDMLQRHPDMNIMVGTSALDGIGILQAKKSLGRNEVKIFGFDNLPEMLEAIQNGEIVATVSQRPYLMGYDSVRLLNDYLHHKSLPKQHFTQIAVIDKSNVTLE